MFAKNTWGVKADPELNSISIAANFTSKYLIFKTPIVKKPKNATSKVSKHLIFKTPNVKHLKTKHPKCQNT